MRGSTLILSLLPLLLVISGCDDRKSTAPSSGSGIRTSAPGARKPDPVSPVTGISKIQRDHDMWAEIVAQQERMTPPDQTTVRQAIKGIEILTIALDRSIRADARLSIRKKHGRMTQQLSRLREKIGVMTKEVREIKTILGRAAKGIAPIPPGYTQAELQDTASDRSEDLRRLRKDEDELLNRLREIEQRLQAKVAEPPTESMATRELESVKALGRRAEALLDR